MVIPPSIILLSAPLCPKPPDIPIEGVIDFEPIVFDQETVKSCAIENKILNLKCNSFLKIYIPSTTFGRSYNESSSVGKMLCDGAEQADGLAAQGTDCIEDVSVVGQARLLCHGRSSCSVPVTSDMASLGPTCSLLKKELRTEHICGKNNRTIQFVLIFLQLSATPGRHMWNPSIVWTHHCF